MLEVLFYDNVLTNKDLEDKLPSLPAPVQQRIERHKRLPSRLHSLAGYLLLERVLKEQNQSIAQLTFSAVGKPYLPNSPFSFSISHNANKVGLAWMLEKGNLGLDIQEFRNFDPIESAFSFFSEPEQQAILKSEAPHKTLIEYWSKKEALIKAGSGRMFDEAASTNTINANCLWKGEPYYWKKVPATFSGAIWVAANRPLEKLSVKKCPFI